MKNLIYKTKRTVVFTMMMLLTLSLNAQINDIVKFMGVPIDGTTSEMISKLQEKGFKYDEKEDCLNGMFNGELVKVIIETKNDLVYKIKVTMLCARNESDIKNDFNNLVRQYENNEKYYSTGENQLIDDNVNIVPHKTKAHFHQCYTKAEVGIIKQVLHEKYDDLMKDAPKSPELKNLGISSDRDKEDNIDALAAMYKMSYIMHNDVWFTVSESLFAVGDDTGSKHYSIVIYYENLYNKLYNELIGKDL